MKKLLLVILSLSALNYSCSKKDHIAIEPPSPPPLIEYPIDLIFSINPSCSISYDDGAGYPLLEEKDFSFYAYSTATLPHDTLGAYTDINVYQSYFYANQTYSVPTFEIREQGPINYFTVQSRNNFNFFFLPYQSGVASFSDTCYVSKGSGRYMGISQKTTPMIFSGFIDTVNGTGSIRIKGSVYL